MLRVWLLSGLFLLSMGFYGSAQDCESNIEFAFANDKMVVLYNLSTGYDQVEWQIEGGQIMHQHDGATVVTFNSFPAKACLTIYNSAGCEQTTCVDIYPGSPDDMCLTRDCIWPGDANGDGKANHLDILQIGPAYGAVGYPRDILPVPDNPNAWMPNMGSNWEKYLGGVDYKHIDSDGDGQVLEDDMEAIDQNYSPDLDYQTDQDANGPKVYITFMDSLVQIDPNDNRPIELGIRVEVGTSDFPVENVRGIAFSLDYPGAIVEPGSAAVTYNDSSFFGPAEDLLTIQRDLQPISLSRLDVGLVTKGGVAVSGFGTIFQGNFIVIADIAVGRGKFLVPFEVGISKVALIDAEGNRIPVQIESQVASVGLEFGTVTSNRPDPALNRQISLFPNPTSDVAQVRWDNLSPEMVLVRDGLGKMVFQSRVSGNSLSLNTKNWAPGIYSVQVVTPAGIAVKPLLVK